MSSRYLTKNQYVNFVASRAILHNCRLVDIDFSGRTIDIAGPRGAVQTCCTELEELLGRYNKGKKQWFG